MNKIETYSCEKGHRFLPTKVCPFCCAINNICPNETNELFKKIYNDIKGKSEKEIDAYYQAFLPSEHEKDLTDIQSMFW